MPHLNFSFAEWEKVATTLSFIKDAHEGQFYGDRPYWTHPLQVALTVDNPSLDEFLAALLHDVVEDTEWSLTDLSVTFSKEVVDMVALLTKDSTMGYRENIQRIIDSGNIGAMKVKLADNRVNASGDKSHMTADRADRLVKKYEMSIEMLTYAIGNA